jgi:type I restriction enzyme, S subunit
MNKLLYKPLSDCVRSLSGGTPSKSNDSFWSGTLPWVSSGEMGRPRISDTELHITHQAGGQHSKIVPAGTILVVVRGMSLAKEFRVSLTQREMAFNQDLKALIPKENVNSLFLFYSLYGRRFEISKLASESAHGTKKLDTKVLDAIPVFLPDITIQKKIAAIVSAYDDLIENNDRRITLLEKIAEEIYREWFVRLRFPGHEQATFHKGIPEGWEIKKLEDFCEKVTDGTHDTPKPTDEGYFLITGKNLKNGVVNFENAYKISKKDHINISKRSGLKPGDIIFSNIGTLGSMAIVTDNIDYSVKNVLIFRPINENQSVFLYYMLKEQYVLENLLLHSSGASQQFIGLTVARQFKVFDPGQISIDNFGEFVLPLQKQMMSLVKTNSKLKQTRDRLLTRLISGKLSVEDLDIQFPPSMIESMETSQP